MLLQAARDLGLDLTGSWMIGDQPRDIEAGHSAGCRTVQLGSLPESATFAVAPTASATDFGEAVDLILASGKPSRGRGEEMTEFSQLRRAIDDLAESSRPRGTGSARAIGAGLLLLAPLPFVAGLLFLEEPQNFLAWMLVTMVILLASIASLLLERR